MGCPEKMIHSKNIFTCKSEYKTYNMSLLKIYILTLLSLDYIYLYSILHVPSIAFSKRYYM